jgi:hypothetical protein
MSTNNIVNNNNGKKTIITPTMNINNAQDSAKFCLTTALTKTNAKYLQFNLLGVGK